MRNYLPCKASSNGFFQNGEISLIMKQRTSRTLEWCGTVKEWECVQVNHHKNIGRTVEQWQRSGWRLHTYTCAQVRPSEIYHYLLFERGIRQ